VVCGVSYADAAGNKIRAKYLVDTVYLPSVQLRPGIS
jgi:hypothetical protein